MRATPNSASCFGKGVSDIIITLTGIGERSHNFSMYLASFRPGTKNPFAPDSA